MKLKKLVSMLAVAMFCTSAPTVLAEESTSVFSFTIPEYISISIDNTSQSDTGVRLIPDTEAHTTTLKTSKALSATYSITSNAGEDVNLYLHAIAGSDATGYALWYDSANSHLAFANTKDGRVPNGVAVRSTLMKSGFNPNDNPEVIAFPITITSEGCTLVKNGVSKGATTTIAPGVDATISLNIAAESENTAGTLSAVDSAGTYTSTIYLTTAAPLSP